MVIIVDKTDIIKQKNAVFTTRGFTVTSLQMYIVNRHVPIENSDNAFNAMGPIVKRPGENIDIEHDMIPAANIDCVAARQTSTAKFTETPGGIFANFNITYV